MTPLSVGVLAGALSALVMLTGPLVRTWKRYLIQRKEG